MLAGLILSGVLGAVPPQLPPPIAVPARPFSHLFQLAQPEVKPLPQPQPQPQPRAQRSRTKVVCGMTLILVGPEVDPVMPKEVPKDSGIKYTMRRYPPPACGQDEKTEEKKR